MVDSISDDVEYVIIDGGSTDETIDYLNNIFHHNQDKTIIWVSEPDNGIYDAMNKGIAMASGTWLIFMNAGDTFYAHDTLEKIIPSLDKKKAIVYGDMFYNGKIVPAENISILKSGVIMACHQSMFFNKELIGQDLKYNLSYPIYADYELVVKITEKNKYTTTHIKIPVSIYEGGGVSDKISKQKRYDKYKIVYKYYGFLGVYNSLFYWIKNKIKRKIKMR
ncbi:glycosyltransferase [Providencia stuartii]|uniref:glycosyltransferase n=1 Tax=Providencia stuartii TaxID=588 RepID=UPI0009B637A4